MPSVAHLRLSVLPEVGPRTDVVAEALLLRREKDRARYPDDGMCGHYLGYLEDRPDAVSGAVRAIADAPGAVIVHCAAGKDRTGVVIALRAHRGGSSRGRSRRRLRGHRRETRGHLAPAGESQTYEADVKRRPVDRTGRARRR